MAAESAVAGRASRVDEFGRSGGVMRKRPGFLVRPRESGVFPHPRAVAPAFAVNERCHTNSLHLTDTIIHGGRGRHDISELTPCALTAFLQRSSCGLTARCHTRGSPAHPHTQPLANSSGPVSKVPSGSVQKLGAHLQAPCSLLVPAGAFPHLPSIHKPWHTLQQRLMLWHLSPHRHVPHQISLHSICDPVGLWITWVPVWQALALLLMRVGSAPDELALCCGVPTGATAAAPAVKVRA